MSAPTDQDMPASVLHQTIRDLTPEQRKEYLSKFCQHPVRMEKRFGKGFILINCGRDRPEECMYCAEQSRLAKLDVAFSGFKDENAHRINDCYQFYVTYTLPPFGKVHLENEFSVRDSAFRGKQKKPKICPCGEWHFKGSGLAGVPIRPETYRYGAQVFANNELGKTFHYARKFLNDAIMGRDGKPLDYYAVTEMNKRGTAHKHVIYSVPVDVVRTFDADEKEAVKKLVKVFKKSATVKHWTSRGPIGFGTNCLVDVIPPLPEVPTDAETKDFKLAVNRTLIYVVKYLGKGGPAAALEQDASLMQLAHYKRLKAVAYELGYKPRIANNFGCSGHSMSRSKTWGIALKDVHQRRREYRAGLEAELLSITVDELSSQKEQQRLADVPEDGVHFDQLSGMPVMVVGGCCYDLATGDPMSEYKFKSTKKPRTLDQLRRYRENGYTELDYEGSDSTRAQVERLLVGNPRLALNDLNSVGDPDPEPSVLHPAFLFLSRLPGPADLETAAGSLEIEIAHDIDGGKSPETLVTVMSRLANFPEGGVPVYVTYLGQRVFMGCKGNSRTQRLAGRLKRWRDLEFVTVSIGV